MPPKTAATATTAAAAARKPPERVGWTRLRNMMSLQICAEENASTCFKTLEWLNTHSRSSMESSLKCHADDIGAGTGRTERRSRHVRRKHTRVTGQTGPGSRAFALWRP